MSYGGRSRKDTANQAASKVRRAALAACPKCGRKSALRSFTDGFNRYEDCRWRDRGLCDYTKFTALR